MKLIIPFIATIICLAFSSHVPASESQAFEELCESFNNCAKKEPEIQTQVIIQKEVIYVEAPVSPTASTTTKHEEILPSETIQPSTVKTAANQHIFNNQVVGIKILGFRASQDNKTLIAQVNLTNQLDKTLWLYAADSNHFMISDSNAKIWRLKKVTGLSQFSYSKTRFSPKSSSKCQLVFELNENKELTDTGTFISTPPYFMSGKMHFSTEKIREHFAFGFDNISIH